MDRQPIRDVIELTVVGAGKGDNSNFVWQVGRDYSIGKGRRAECSAILHDTNSYYFNGQARWSIYVKLPNGEEVAHVHYENCQVFVKCSIPEII